jgi:hypothetical protein
VLLGIAGLVAYAVSKFSSGRLVVIVTAISLVGFFIALIGLAIGVKRPAHKARVVGGSLLAVVLGAYLVLFLFLTFFQDAIANQTSAFFQPRKLAEAAAQALLTDDIEPIDVTTPDDAGLRGWLVRNSTASPSPLVIFFDGSGSESSAMIPYARQLDGWQVALVNYRGFGQSTGTPSHARALADAVLLYDTLVQRPDIDPQRVAAMGYSLGTGVAVQLAAVRPIAASVLVAPYDSMTLIGLKQSPLFAPLMGIMKRYFDSMALAPDIDTPLFALVGTADTAVLPERSLKLVEGWGGETQVNQYEGEDHNLLMHENSSWRDIAQFLERVAQD